MNFNLRGDSLKHCMNVSECKAVIYTPDMEAALKDISSQLKSRVSTVFAAEAGSIENAKSLQVLLNLASTLSPT